MRLVANTREDSSHRGMVVRTFLIADIRGYSPFTRERSDETAARLATKFANLGRDAVAARGGRVMDVLPTDLRAWVRFACQVAGRELTRAEWSDLLPERSYRPICSQ